MIDLFFASPLLFLIIFPGLLLAITIHEFAHAWMADRLGDPTPRSQGRLTLDPRAHLDPLGTLAILLTRFGWGKPVEFDPYNLREPLRDSALIALAGPASNIIMAIILSLVLRFVSLPWEWLAVGLLQVLIINVVLAIFNLVPVYPLDGSKIILALLPPQAALEYESFMHRYGMWLLIFIIFPWNGASLVSQFIWPLVQIVVTALLGAA